MSSAPREEIEPVDEANDADRAEQLTPLDDDVYDEQVELDTEANDADVVEQARPVPVNEDDYPRG